MKTKLFFLLVLFLATTRPSIAFQEQQDHKVLFEKAMYTMETKGDLKEAITLFESLIKTYPDEKEYVAKALFYVGLCYEKLGNLRAKSYYENVINNYSDQSELVQLAQISLKRVLETEKPADDQLASLQVSELNKEDDGSLSVINLYEKGSWLEGSSLSPDGTKIAGIEYSIGQNVNVYDRLTNETQMITKYEWMNPDDGYTYFPVWSPDGKELVYMFCDNSEICEIQGSTLQGIKRTLYKNEAGEGQIYPKQWSQDGSKILAFKQDSTDAYIIGLIPSEGGSFTALYKTNWKERFIKADASLSPDGKYVVFADGEENNLDIFIIDINGGPPTLLCGYPANESDPLWSPDGKHIVYIQEIKGGSVLYALEMAEGKSVGQPFIIKEGMQNADLINWTTHGISYDFTLDLREIHTLSLDPETGTSAGVPKLLDYTPAGSNICPVWSYDGKYLAFISYDDKPEVVILAADGEEKRHFTIPSDDFWAPSVFDLHWLPDNSGLGFNLINRLDISIMHHLDIATGEWQNWTLPVEGWTRTDWGPDENSFIYTNWGEEPGLYQFDIKTEKTHRIYEPDTSYAWYAIRDLKFSRDHKKLTLMLGNREIVLLDLQTGESRILAQKFWSPTFAPDGEKMLLFCPFGEEKNVRTGVAVLSLDGKILQQYDIAQYFTSGTRIYHTDWSPSGKQLVFNTRNLKMDTYLMKNVLK